MRQQSLNEHDRISSGKTDSIGVRFQQEKQQAGELGPHRFDPCLRQQAKVDKYQFAQFDKVKYSVPRECAFQTVTVKGYVDRVEIVFNHTSVACHQRSYQTGDQVLDPVHYLTTLERRPAALDHSNVSRNWTLPAVFDELRDRLEHRHGDRAGIRQYVRVLQLLAHHPVQRVHRVIEQMPGADGADAEQIIRRVQQATECAGDQAESTKTTLSCDELSRPEVLSVQVPSPGLSHFDQFLSPSNHRSDPDVPINEHHQPTAGEQPQTTEAAHDECGVLLGNKTSSPQPTQERN